MVPIKGQISEADTPSGLLRHTSPEAAAVRLQLDRLLASQQFRTSKRCQALLTHVIESYLDGALDRVKERIIGFAVFGRDPGYDTNQDSVVRTTAAEVRKRLAQYYLEPNHEQDLRFLLPPGSYVPEFRLPLPPAPARSATPVPAPAPGPAVVPTPVGAGFPRSWVWAAAALIPLSAAILWFLPRFRQNELDAFWRPLIEDRADVVICIEQPLRIYTFDGPRVDELNSKMVGTSSLPAAPGKVLQGTPLNLSELKTVGNRYFSFGDAMASIRVAELLARKGKPFQVLGDRATSYHDLRGRPAVLVGEFNNQWTNGLIRGLRYYIEKNAESRTYDVRDRQSAGKVIASVTREVTRPAEYAIVSRVFDASTEKTVIAVSGMTYAGTGAVGDFLTTPAYMHEAFQKAPADWYRKSIQVVLETTLVGGTAGPPKVVTTYFW
jgi:hypothetical protein